MFFRVRLGVTIGLSENDGFGAIFSNLRVRMETLLKISGRSLKKKKKIV